MTSNRSLHLMVTAALAFAPVTIGACSSSNGGSPDGSGGTTVNPDRVSALCPKPELLVYPSPNVYSAFDGVHTFKVPAAVVNVDQATVTWSTSDPSLLDIEKDPGGDVMLVIHKAGEADIAAKSGNQCGVTRLKVTAATPAEWKIGSDRYNNGIKYEGEIPEQEYERRDASPGQTTVACTNCHGDTATTGSFTKVSHTPTQAGGFSDDELINAFTKAILPPNAHFDNSVVDYETWRGFHQWSMSPAETKGVVVYLRSLTPTKQTGSRSEPDGGGGGPPPAMTSPTADAGMSGD